MNPADDLLLWGSLERRFLIPLDASLPEGPLPLTSMHATFAFVDEAAALPFEVTREEADAFLQRWLEGKTEPVAKALAALLPNPRG